MIAVAICFMLAALGSAFLGRLLQIIAQVAQEQANVADLPTWAILFYIAAGVLALLAMLELVFGVRRRILRASAHRGVMPPKHRHKRKR